MTEKIFISSKNFNDIFRKDVTYDNIKIKKKSKPSSVSKKYIFGKTRGRMSNWTPQPFKD